MTAVAKRAGLRFRWSAVKTFSVAQWANAQPEQTLVLGVTGHILLSRDNKAFDDQ
jgi:hypothetical protein